ncbi:hypothetical protein VR7878_01343 [Vibrio ruber DSM 16370]|uniref:AraC-type arabinose-binding/dimerisation domain-containing protein n=1 Tax=Vibrio ruber (strain DSM 16370 / JCM 11486 / BCRC 17186 / CECT 7878 / LMG 23124 / VR1) TaxID=1123498 RepID=A0A1R4LGD1_VIBR1|nr:hypothetical protein [Vibrio ruber]SJN55602.1 hypothetical protein VR7878_01343 [Vibrio ruber DSM 16370]
MHYAIQVDSTTTDYLQITARKKSLKHVLLLIEQGTVLLKLGKYEYAATTQQALWIPCQCLHALTIFPRTRLTRIEFSARLRHNFPLQAGFVTLSPLCRAVLARLTDTTPQMAVHRHLLGVLTDEVLQFAPELRENKFSHLLKQWQTQYPHPVEGISPEVHLILLLREAQKKMQSGMAAAQVANQLFDGQLAQLYQLRENLLGLNSDIRS